MFSAVIANKDLKEDVIGMKFALNFKFIYNGGEAMCDAETVDMCNKVVFKTDEELKDEKNTSRLSSMEEFFVPLNTRDAKYRDSERNKGTIVSEQSSMFDVLESFKMVSSRKFILTDTKGHRYQLLTLEQGGYLHTY